MISPETKERMRRRFYAHSKDYRPLPWCDCGSVNISESVKEGDQNMYRIMKCNECGRSGFISEGFHICEVPGNGRALPKEFATDFRDWLRKL